MLGRFKISPTTEKTLNWLQAEIEDEIKDREDADETDWIDRVLVASGDLIKLF